MHCPAGFLSPCSSVHLTVVPSHVRAGECTGTMRRATLQRVTNNSLPPTLPFRQVPTMPLLLAVQAVRQRLLPTRRARTQSPTLITESRLPAQQPPYLRLSGISLSGSSHCCQRSSISVCLHYLCSACFCFCLMFSLDPLFNRPSLCTVHLCAPLCCRLSVLLDRFFVMSWSATARAYVFMALSHYACSCALFTYLCSCTFSFWATASHRYLDPNLRVRDAVVQVSEHCTMLA